MMHGKIWKLGISWTHVCVCVCIYVSVCVHMCLCKGILSSCKNSKGLIDCNVGKYKFICAMSMCRIKREYLWRKREWLIRLNNNNDTITKWKVIFLFLLSVSLSFYFVGFYCLLHPRSIHEEQSYSSMNIHSPRLLNPDFLKTNLSFLLSLMYSPELAFYLWAVTILVCTLVEVNMCNSIQVFANQLAIIG